MLIPPEILKLYNHFDKWHRRSPPLSSPSPSSAKTLSASCCSPSNTTPSTKCTKSIWPLSGRPTKSTSPRTSKTGRDSTNRKNTSSNTSWPSSRPQMESCYRIWRSSSAPRCRSLRLGASMASRLPWKTCTLRLTPC